MVAFGNAIVRIAAVAGVVLLLITLFANRPAKEIGYFSTGPQVSVEGSIEVDPPMLTIPSSPAWDREKHRALFLIDQSGEYRIEARTSYDPEGGQPRVSFLTTDGRVPRPAEAGDVEAWPGFLLCAPPDADGDDVAGTAGALLSRGGPARLYLGGRLADGRFGAVPLVSSSSLIKGMRRLGSALTPRDLTGSENSPEGRIEIRISRDEDQVTYLWGRPAWVRGDESRWAGGVVTLGCAEVHRGEGLEDLTEYLEDRYESVIGPRAIVILQVGTGVTYEQVLRAVECGKGSSEIDFFQPDWNMQRSLEDLILPEPSDPKYDSLLIDDEGPDYLRMVLTLLEDGTMKMLGKHYTLETLEKRLREYKSDQEVGLLVRADRTAKYADWKQVIHIARKLDLKIGLAFAQADPQIPEERALRLAPVDLSKKPDSLLMTDETPMQKVYDEILELLHAGASGISFP